MTLLLKDTPVALWQDIIHEAEAACTISLKEELESYLVFLLMRYTDKPEMIKHVMANEFLTGINQPRHNRLITLQGVGDKCLLYSGLFPQLAEKRLVKVSYYVKIGQSAYSAISHKSTDLYGMLSRHFVPLMDILQSVRRYNQEFTDLLPLEAYEIWNETGSQRALRVLKNHTNAIPLKKEGSK